MTTLIALPKSVAEGSRRLDPVTPERVEQVEAALLKLPQIDCPLTHRFAPGLCIREVVMPAGATVIGHTHRMADLNVLVSGRLTLLMEDGSLKELVAPLSFVGKPGRKIAYIQETVTWQNIWPTTVIAGGEVLQLGTSIEAIEAYYLDKSGAWQADQAQRLALARMEREPDRADYEAFLAEHGLDEKRVRHISENPLDQMPMPEAESCRVQVLESPIEGLGLFATGPFAAGEVIAPARVGFHRTPAGRFTNHSGNPNAAMLAKEDGDIDLIALRPIAGCRGGQPGEEITVDYRQAILAAKQFLPSTKLETMKGLL